MPIRIRPGFRGIVRINGEKFIRVSNADISLRQDAIPFLPSYAGVQLRRIWHIGTGDVTSSLSIPLCQDSAAFLYSLASTRTEFFMDLYYYGGSEPGVTAQDRRILGCVINELTFDCKAGEVASVSVSIVGKEITKPAYKFSYTKGQKLVTWDRCQVRFPTYADTYIDEAMQSFTYTISNDLKTIKTAASVLPKVINPAIQDVRGSFAFYNSKDIVLPLRSDLPFGLAFRDGVRWLIDDLEIEHSVVFHPTQSVPLTPAAIVSMVNWTRSDSFD